ncbi:hypothetical protein K7432_002803 [Basidiobolus ranarum]|uniref:Uncharacterized protein n=1 Tax=Basidiobolus ranarum TaxID=34480 RepID=A0ABR2W756_9FUNG
MKGSETSWTSVFILSILITILVALGLYICYRRSIRLVPSGTYPLRRVNSVIQPEQEDFQHLLSEVVVDDEGDELTEPFHQETTHFTDSDEDREIISPQPPVDDFEIDPSSGIFAIDDEFESGFNEQN